MSGGACDETSSEAEQQGDHLEANAAISACSGSSYEQFMLGSIPPAQPLHAQQQLLHSNPGTLSGVSSSHYDDSTSIAAVPLPLQPDQPRNHDRYPIQQARPAAKRNATTMQQDCSESFANLSDFIVKPEDFASKAVTRQHVSAYRPAPLEAAPTALMSATISSSSTMPRPALLPTLSGRSLSSSSLGSLQSPGGDVNSVRPITDNMRKSQGQGGSVQARRNRVRSHQAMTADSSGNDNIPVIAASSKSGRSIRGATTKIKLQPATKASSSSSGATTTSNIKLQPATSNRVRSSADLQLLRTRRRLWLEEQARQIAKEEQRLQDNGAVRGGMSNSLLMAGVSASDLAKAMLEGDPHRQQQQHKKQQEQRDTAAALADTLRRPSATADAAAHIANTMLGSPLPTPGSSGRGSSGTGATHFRNRSISITGMVIPSPASDRFILNMPFGGDDDDGTVAQGLAEMEVMDGNNEGGDTEDAGDIACGTDSIGASGTEFCMDEDSKKEEENTDEDGDESVATVVMDMSKNDDQPVEGAADRSMEQQHHYPSMPNFLSVKLPTIIQRRPSDGGRQSMGDFPYPLSEDLVIPPRPRSTDPWLSSRRCEALDSRGPSTNQGDALPSLLEGDFVPPPRPHSSEPRFDASIDVGRLQGKISPTGSTALAAQQAKPTGRIVSGPTPSPLPIYSPEAEDGVVEDGLFSSRPSSRSSSRPPSVLKQPLLNGEESRMDTKDLLTVSMLRKDLLKVPMLRMDPSPTLHNMPPPPSVWQEKQGAQPEAAGFLKSQTLDNRLQISFEAAGFLKSQTLDNRLQISFAGDDVEVSLPSLLSTARFDTLTTSADETTAAAPLPSRPANVSTLDRSASIIDRAPVTVFADSCSGTGQSLFTPPTIGKSVVSFAQAPRGNENTAPSCPDSSDRLSATLVTLPDLPHPPLTQQLPNMSTFGRSSSVGGQLLGSPEGSTCCTPSNQIDTSGQEDVVNKIADRRVSQQVPYRARQPPFSRGPLPSLPLASPTEEEEEDTFEYSPPPGVPDGPFVAFKEPS